MPTDPPHEPPVAAPPPVPTTPPGPPRSRPSRATPVEVVAVIVVAVVVAWALLDRLQTGGTPEPTGGAIGSTSSSVAPAFVESVLPIVLVVILVWTVATVPRGGRGSQ